jgi:hypothetical protein
MTSGSQFSDWQLNVITSEWFEQLVVNRYY